MVAQPGMGTGTRLRTRAVLHSQPGDSGTAENGHQGVTRDTAWPKMGARTRQGRGWGQGHGWGQSPGHGGAGTRTSPRPRRRRAGTGGGAAPWPPQPPAPPRINRPLSAAPGGALPHPGRTNGGRRRRPRPRRPPRPAGAIKPRAEPRAPPRFLHRPPQRRAVRPPRTDRHHGEWGGAGRGPQPPAVVPAFVLPGMSGMGPSALSPHRAWLALNRTGGSPGTRYRVWVRSAGLGGCPAFTGAERRTATGRGSR